MNETDKALATILQKLTTVADAHVADAVLLGGRVIQLCVAQYILCSLFGVVVSVFCLLRFLRCWRFWERKIYKDTPPQVALWGILLGVIGLISGISFCINVLSPLYWAILFDVRLAVAAKVLGLIGS